MSGKRKKKQPKRNGSRPWEAVIGGFVAVAIVAGIFWLTNSGSEQASRELPPALQSQNSGGPVPSSASSVTHEEIEAVERIEPDEAKRLLDAGQAITIDVRDVQSYVAGHIPGALQIPLQYVPGEIPWFPRDKKIITYCT